VGGKKKQKVDFNCSDKKKSGSFGKLACFHASYACKRPFFFEKVGAKI
jgi:hypothetical protein